MVRSKGLALAAAAACAALAGGQWARAAGPAALIPATAPGRAAGVTPLMMVQDVPATPGTTAGPSLQPGPAPAQTPTSPGAATGGPTGATNTGTGVSTPPGNTVVAPPGSTVVVTPPPQTTTAQPTYTPPPATEPAPAATEAAVVPTATPLMRLLEKVGVGKGLEDAGISVTGYVEGGYTYDFSAPPGNVLTDRAFDTRHDSPELDQVQLLVSRSVDYTKPLDIGFTFENIYGTDTPYFHANGLTLVSYGSMVAPFGSPINRGGALTSANGGTSTIHPRAQYDLTQAFFQVSSNAVAKGIAFEGGKFATLLGTELIDAYSGSATNAFYSHSFIFINEPYTHTGALGIINLSDTVTFTGGMSRGWDQATEDNNGNIDFLGQLKISPDKSTTLFLNGITGNEQATVPAGFVGLNGWRTVFDVVAQHTVGDNLTLTANAMYAWEAQTGAAGGPGGGIGQWYAVAGYASYKVSDFLTLNGRAEWFNDPDGAAPTQFAAVRRPNEYYEFTLGTTIHPFPQQDLLNNFFIRPEVRFDYADKAEFDTISTGPSDHYFFTFGVDGVYAF